MKEPKNKTYVILAVGMASIFIITAFLFQYSTGESVLTAKQLEKYNKYELLITEHTTLEDILPFCTEVKKEKLKEKELIILTSNELMNYLKECQKIEEIAIIENQLSHGSQVCTITYIAHDQSMVYLEYSKEGLLRLSMYNERKNTFVLIEDGVGTLQRNFI